MATLSIPAVPLAGEDAYSRQRSLRHRMRALAIAGATAMLGVIVVAAYAYPSMGLSGAAILLVACGAVVFEGLRQTDRRFVAPLQARCQDDFNRQMEALFGPMSAISPRVRREWPGGHPCL